MCVYKIMNDFERIDFIKQQWKKFLKKKIKKDIDISKIESIVEIKQALKIREAVETISGEFKIDSNMINLIGSSKENFFKLLNLINYKSKKKEGKKEEYFVYKPKSSKNNKLNKNQKRSKNNPFEKLLELRLR